MTRVKGAAGADEGLRAGERFYTRVGNHSVVAKRGEAAGSYETVF